MKHGGLPSPSPTAFPAVVSLPVVLGAASWALSIVFFVVQAIAQAAFARPYDIATNLISDLGNTACGPVICSPLHAVMNVTFIVVGGLHWLGAIATQAAWPRRPVSSVGRALVAFAGVGLILAGAAPENVQGAVHARGALLGPISLNLAMIVLGLSIMGAWRPLGIAALIAGVIGLVGFGLFLTAAIPPGLAERLADYPGAVMVVVFGIFLLVSSARGRPSNSRTG